MINFMDFRKLIVSRISPSSRARVFYKMILTAWELHSIILYLFLINIPASQSLPLDRSDLDLSRSPPNIENSTSNAIVRVIASSSSSRSSGKGQLYHHTTFHYQPPSSTPKPSHFHPTTYHPQFQKFPSFHQQHFHQPQFTRPPVQLRRSPFYFERNQQYPRSLQNQAPTDIFSAFFNAFAQQSAERFAFPMPPSTPPPLAPIISVVSESHSVSASEPVEAEPRRSYRKNQNSKKHHTSHRRSNDDPEKQDRQAERYQAIPKAMADDMEDTFMFQSDQPQEPQISIGQLTEKEVENVKTRWEEPEKIWGEPEKVWGEPEKVWGQPEQNWEQPETWESQKEFRRSEPIMTLVEPYPTNPDAEEDTSVRFYELGEDEEDEPKELVLDKNAMQATIETAQLAARSWELPELTQLGLIPNQSFVRTALEGMTAESIQIPFRTNIQMPKVRMTLDTGGTRAKAIPSLPNPSVITNPVALAEGPTGKKFGYVLDGSDVRKYRVEERTPDGFIVGEYGVLNHNNGFLRGVRYTADGTINPRLIHEALMKFLSL